MPIPLIPAIAVAAATVTATRGIKKGIDAKNDMNDAKNINLRAKQKVEKNEKQLKEKKDLTSKTIEKLGRIKVEILSTSMYEFVETFGKIKNVDYEEEMEFDELKKFNPCSNEFIQLRKVSYEAQEIVGNGVLAISSGALLAFGTYNVVMSGLGGILVTATTGTALSSLSGVAATNATLAWLGGGALSVGGLGMAGGMAVLGGLVVGPALLVGGSLFAKQAEQAYFDAINNEKKANDFEEQVKTISRTLKAIRTRAFELTSLLENLNVPFYCDSIMNIKKIIEEKGVYWNSYNIEEKKEICRCVKISLMIKTILDTPLLNEKGELKAESKDVVAMGQKFLEDLEEENVSM